MVKMCAEGSFLENNTNLTNGQVFEDQNGVDLDMTADEEAATEEGGLKLQKLAGGSLISHAPIPHPSGR